MAHTKTEHSNKKYVEHLISRLHHLTHNKSVARRMKEKRDDEFELEMKHFDEDIIEQKAILEEFVRLYPEQVEPYKEWLERNGIDAPCTNHS